MLIKFLKHSKGSGRAAINYLLGEKDHKGERRASVKVLCGDPYLTADLIDSLDNIHRYTSSVIAWHPDDKPGKEEIEEVLRDFERIAFSGLETDQFTYCAVLHADSDGTEHVHIVIPRVELRTGNSLNIAPPGHEHYFKHWRDAWNSEKGWASPADVKLVRSPRDKELPAWKFQRFSKEVVQEFLVKNLKAGAFRDRNEMISFLNRHGEVGRVGKDYISFKPRGKEKAVRMKGAIFSEGWNFDVKNDEKKKPDINEAENHRIKLNEIYLKRVAYNKNRYKIEEKENFEIIDEISEEDILYEAADSYPESIIRAIESAAEFNRVAAEYNRKFEESGFESITDRAKRSIERTEQQITRTDFAIDRTKQSFDEVGEFIGRAEKQLPIFEESIKIAKKFISSLTTGLRNILSINVNKEMQLIINANAARNKLEKDKKEERIEREREELFEALNDAIQPNESAFIENNELIIQKEALHRINFMSQEVQQDRVVEYLMQKNSSVGFRDAAMQVDALIYSGSEEALSEYNQMLLRSVIDDIAIERNIAEKSKKETGRKIGIDLDGPSR